MSIDNIARQAVAFSKISHDYSFYPTGLIMIDDKVVGKIGNLDYDNKLFQISHGVRIGDYFFCLEKRTDKNIELIGEPEKKNQQVVGAFRGTMHYQFISLDDNEDLHDTYMRYLITTFIDSSKTDYVIKEL